MILKTIIADQENKYAPIIHEYLKDHKGLEIVRVFDNFEAGINYLVTYPWDLLILYVPKPTNECKGSELNKVIAPQTILIADDPEFAAESYEIDGPEYILTPFTKERLLHAVEKYCKYYSRRDVGELELLVDNYKVSIKSGRSILSVKINDILYLEGMGVYIKMHLTDSKFIIYYGTFETLMQILPNELIIRCHRSYCINRRHLEAILPNRCILKGEISIPISVKYKSLVTFI